jgi:hypothetical protein
MKTNGHNYNDFISIGIVFCSAYVVAVKRASNNLFGRNRDGSWLEMEKKFLNSVTTTKEGRGTDDCMISAVSSSLTVAYKNGKILTKFQFS